MSRAPGVWFPAVKVGTGADVFTQRLCKGLNARGIRASITWLPHRAELFPWSVAVPTPPKWATVAHVNTWLHPRFVSRYLPLVATLHHSVHDPSLRLYKGGLRAMYHRHWIAPIERRVMRRARAVVAVSQFAADMGRRTLCDVPMWVIRNGVDTAYFCPSRDRRDDLGKGTPFRLLYVGNWKDLKGVDLLTPIMRELGEGYELHYTGGPAAARDKASMPPNMHDLGLLDGDQVVSVMQQADVLLFPSRSEGFGLVAVEAMACGLPVVAAASASLPEIVEDGVTGALCPRDDIQAFVLAVRKLADDRGAWHRMSRTARNVARQSFDLEAMIEEYVSVYYAVTGTDAHVDGTGPARENRGGSRAGGTRSLGGGSSAK